MSAVRIRSGALNRALPRPSLVIGASTRGERVPRLSAPLAPGPRVGSRDLASPRSRDHGVGHPHRTAGGACSCRRPSSLLLGSGSHPPRVSVIRGMTPVSPFTCRQNSHVSLHRATTSCPIIGHLDRWPPPRGTAGGGTHRPPSIPGPPQDAAHRQRGERQQQGRRDQVPPHLPSLPLGCEGTPQTTFTACGLYVLPLHVVNAFRTQPRRGRMGGERRRWKVCPRGSVLYESNGT